LIDSPKKVTSPVFISPLLALSKPQIAFKAVDFPATINCSTKSNLSQPTTNN